MRPSRLNFNERSSKELRKGFDSTPPKKKKKFERGPMHTRSNSNQMSVPRLILNPVYETILIG